jgi:mitochondrial fission protein ELM1
MRSNGGSGPSTWVLLTHALGDNDQCLALAELLDRPFVIKRLQAPAAKTARARGAKRRLFTALTTSDHRREAGLEEPWPDLVIGCGVLSDRIARWIKQQSQGKTGIVLVGRPHGSIAEYDLVVASPQFGLPPRKNIFHLSLPLSRMARNSPAETPPLRSSTQENDMAWPELTEPWFTILLGGHVRQLAIAKSNLQQVARDARSAVDHWGGSVVVMAGRRTSMELCPSSEFLRHSRS